MPIQGDSGNATRSIRAHDDRLRDLGRPGLTIGFGDEDITHAGRRLAGLAGEPVVAVAITRSGSPRRMKDVLCQWVAV